MHGKKLYWSKSETVASKKGGQLFKFREAGSIQYELRGYYGDSYTVNM